MAYTSTGYDYFLIARDVPGTYTVDHLETATVTYTFKTSLWGLLKPSLYTRINTKNNNYYIDDVYPYNPKQSFFIVHNLFTLILYLASSYSI